MGAPSCSRNIHHNDNGAHWRTRKYSMRSRDRGAGAVRGSVADGVAGPWRAGAVKRRAADGAVAGTWRAGAVRGRAAGGAVAGTWRAGCTAVGLAAAGLAVAQAGPGITALSPVRDRLFPRLSGRGWAGHVALTFDDGPDPAATPLFLEALAE